ncbi:MAG: hypothetical protein ACKOHG_02395 [Planctomycetia bacterium]
MSDLELIDAVAHVTGEDSHEIRRRGFMLAGSEESGPDLDPECLLDVLLVDLPETGTVDWDAVLGDGGFRSPFYTRAQQARRKAKADMRAGNTKQAARAA